MNNILIATCFRILCPIIGAISIYLFLRGHNLPGGGFIGGLCLSLALILHVLANEKSSVEVFIVKNFYILIGVNLFALGYTLLLPVFLNQEILTALWTNIPIPIAGKVSSVLFFDLCIYLVVSISTTRAYIEFTKFSGEGKF